MKVALCIPCYGDPKAKFMQSLASMIAHFLTARIEDEDGNPVDREIETFIVSCSMLTQSRHMLVAEALNWGADYMLFLDADHVFPRETLVHLLSRHKPVIGANYARRCHPTAPTAAKHLSEDDDRKNLVYTTAEKARDELVEEIDHMGFGICLIDMRIFDVLQAKAESEGKSSFLPLFQFEVQENGIGIIGEDVYFFRKIREAGIPVYLDHALSWEVGHIHEQIMTNALAVAHKDRWIDDADKKAKRYIATAERLEKAA